MRRGEARSNEARKGWGTVARSKSSLSRPRGTRSWRQRAAWSTKSSASPRPVPSIAEVCTSGAYLREGARARRQLWRCMGNDPGSIDSLPGWSQTAHTEQYAEGIIRRSAGALCRRSHGAVCGRESYGGTIGGLLARGCSLEAARSRLLARGWLVEGPLWAGHGSARAAGRCVPEHG